VVKQGDRTAVGEQLRNPKGRAVLLAAASAAGWGETVEFDNIGLGIALFEHKPGGGTATAVVTVYSGDHVELMTAAPDTGTGNHTLFRQIVAEALGVSQEAVHLVWGDTETVSDDSGVGGSRVTHVHGQAALRAAEQVLGELRELYREPASGFAELADRAVAANGGPVQAVETYTGGQVEESDFCAQTAEVIVDEDTGQIFVRRIVTAHDVGQIINPLYHQGQIDGGVIQGLGYALMEELQFDQGQVTTLHLGDYKIPNMADIPELVTVLVPGGEGPSPYAAKAIGEHSNSAVAAAIANAVADAVGVRIFDLPITAEKVFNALRAKEQEQEQEPSPPAPRVPGLFD
jgi:CO/xanthine dehydrogenase Mo-binding subunit